MELVSFAKEMLQNVAEQAASYRIGQTLLRHVDRTLWVVEKCARWAVPPPLDQDERPQQELVRPLPWFFFLIMLVALRVTRESISLINLVLGKPPLRSADVVMYIQSKRRYLRTLKYQGNRIMRARTSATQPSEPWYSGLQSLFQFTMCFRRHSLNYGNNNTTRISNNEEILVVKRRNNGNQDEDTVASTSETTMERLIEKIMVDLDADSDEDSSFTLTNAPSVKSESETTTESDQDTNKRNEASPTENDIPTPTSSYEAVSGTTTSNSFKDSSTPAPQSTVITPVNFDETIASSEKDSNSYSSNSSPSKSDVTTSTLKLEASESNYTQETTEKQKIEDAALSRPDTPKNVSPKEETENFLQSEINSPHNAHQSPKKEKIANGRTIKSVPNKKKGDLTERRNSEVPIVKITPADESSDEGKEDTRQPHQNEQ